MVKKIDGLNEVFDVAWGEILTTRRDTQGREGLEEGEPDQEPCCLHGEPDKEYPGCCSLMEVISSGYLDSEEHFVRRQICKKCRNFLEWICNRLDYLDEGFMNLRQLIEYR